MGFFAACLSKMEAPVEDMANWVVEGTWLEGLRSDDQLYQGWHQNDIDEILYRTLRTTAELREIGQRNSVFPPSQ